MEIPINIKNEQKSAGWNLKSQMSSFYQSWVLGFFFLYIETIARVFQYCKKCLPNKIKK